MNALRSAVYSDAFLALIVIGVLRLSWVIVRRAVAYIGGVEKPTAREREALPNDVTIESRADDDGGITFNWRRSEAVESADEMPVLSLSALAEFVGVMIDAVLILAALVGFVEWLRVSGVIR